MPTSPSSHFPSVRTTEPGIPGKRQIPSQFACTLAQGWGASSPTLAHHRCKQVMKAPTHTGTPPAQAADTQEAGVTMRAAGHHQAPPSEGRKGILSPHPTPRVRNLNLRTQEDPELIPKQSPKIPSYHPQDPKLGTRAGCCTTQHCSPTLPGV